MAEAFSFSLDQWLYFGGYPGAAELIDVVQTWTAKKKREQSQTCSLEQRFDQCHRYPEAEPMIIGSEGVPLEDFFTCDLRDLLF